MNFFKRDPYEIIGIIWCGLTIIVVLKVIWEIFA